MRSLNFEGSFRAGTWAYDPDLIDVNEQRPLPMELSVDVEDIEKVWRTLMSHLCPRHRINKRNGHETDYIIEDLRKEYYGAFTDSAYFRRLLSQLARQHGEVEVERDRIRLTKFGLDNCKKYDPTFQKDFEY